MDLTGLFAIGIDAGIVAGIVGVAQGIKYGFSLKNARWFIVVPLFLGLAAALVRAHPWTLTQIVGDMFKYGGAACIAYMLGSKILGKDKA